MGSVRRGEGKPNRASPRAPAQHRVGSEPEVSLSPDGPRVVMLVGDNLPTLITERPRPPTLLLAASLSQLCLPHPSNTL